MKFYNREQELATLEGIYQQCCDGYGNITVLTGRRRVGKTVLAQKFAQNKDALYLFVSKKSEILLCAEFLEQYQELIGEDYIGEIRWFADLFELLLKYGQRRAFVLIIDEFQEFYQINPGIYSEIQKLWDRYKFDTKIHIVLIGSVYSLMLKIFQNQKEPLYGRADRILYIKPFEARVMKQILEDHNNYSGQNLFDYYMITGGVPRYLEILTRNRCYTRNDILNLIFQRDSFFINEGRNLLIQEFGKDYNIYFSILELIAGGRSARPEIESILERTVGGHLERLEQGYDLIEKVKPVTGKRTGRLQRYRIKDQFIKFWFRFIHKNSSLVYGERFQYLKRVIDRDLTTYAGRVLEDLFREIKGYSDQFGAIGAYWERGNRNEIDIVAIDEIDQKIVLTEVKWNPDRISLNQLKGKAEQLLLQFKGYDVVYEGLSPVDIESLLTD